MPDVVTISRESLRMLVENARFHCPEFDNPSESPQFLPYCGAMVEAFQVLGLDPKERKTNA